ncbi:hypothetical protein F2Q70_00031671 [Brassica cretica]|uniref:Uncharacterized protein n=1 Tax=Brassica cretica TaxID=69181 RepID=A0A8S9FH40_BRACR|nr:hypothetical protein F2Q70_00031671 [Brassica cretica]KAF2551698.1 hypothetical protein F2Q68_00036099 [Brassica cretica]
MDDGRTLLNGEEKQEETLDLISEEAGALATAEKGCFFEKQNSSVAAELIVVVVVKDKSDDRK